MSSWQCCYVDTNRGTMQKVRSREGRFFCIPPPPPCVRVFLLFLFSLFSVLPALHLACLSKTPLLLLLSYFKFPSFPPCPLFEVSVASSSSCLPLRHTDGTTEIWGRGESLVVVVFLVFCCLCACVLCVSVACVFVVSLCLLPVVSIAAAVRTCSQEDGLIYYTLSRLLASHITIIIVYDCCHSSCC